MSGVRPLRAAIIAAGRGDRLRNGAAMSETDEEIPYLKALDDVFGYIRKKATELPEGEWIVLPGERRAWQRLLDESEVRRRVPTRQQQCIE